MRFKLGIWRHSCANVPEAFDALENPVRVASSLLLSGVLRNLNRIEAWRNSFTVPYNTYIATVCVKAPGSYQHLILQRGVDVA